MDNFSDDYKAYGDVPIPGSGRLHLPATDVMVSFHYTGDSAEEGIDNPENLELVITAPNGAAQPSVTDDLGDETQIGVGNDQRVQVKVAHIPVAGDYTVTAYGKTSYASPRLAFGHDYSFGWLTWAFVGLSVVSLVGGATMFLRGMRTASSAGPPTSAANTRVTSDLTSARWDVPPPAEQPTRQTEDAAELEQHRQTWAAIDSVVQEFIPEAVRRKTPTKGRGLPPTLQRNLGLKRLLFIPTPSWRYWCVQHAQSERDQLLIWKTGTWLLERVNRDDSTQMLYCSKGSVRRVPQGPAGPTPVEGLREGAMRLLDPHQGSVTDQPKQV
jgi:hypothetical protein